MIAADCEKEKCACMRFSKFLSFLTLSGITDMVHIEQKFNKVHDKFKSQFFYWSIGATRKKLIIGFWYYEIPWHLLTIFMVAWLATFALHPSMFSAVSLMASGSVFALTFLVMIIGIYLPVFGSEYFPNLESCSSRYSGDQNLSIQKCKKQQFTLKTLVLIQHVLEQMAGIQNQFLDSKYLQVLSKQYGVSKQGLQVAAREIFLSKSHAGQGRICTELENSFEEAYTYFQSLNCDRAEQILKSLESRIMIKKLRKTG